MKKWITVALLLGGFCGYAEMLTINVTTEGPRKGVIAVLIFTSKKGWPSKNTVAFRKARFPVTKKGPIVCSVTNLPYGSYSLSILHDVNDNYKAYLLIVDLFFFERLYAKHICFTFYNVYHILYDCF